jgi:hypothetical protein
MAHFRRKGRWDGLRCGRFRRGARNGQLSRQGDGSAGVGLLNFDGNLAASLLGNVRFSSKGGQVFNKLRLRGRGGVAILRKSQVSAAPARKQRAGAKVKRFTDLSVHVGFAAWF